MVSPSAVAKAMARQVGEADIIFSFVVRLVSYRDAFFFRVPFFVRILA